MPPDGIDHQSFWEDSTASNNPNFLHLFLGEMAFWSLQTPAQGPQDKLSSVSQRHLWPLPWVLLTHSSYWHLPQIDVHVTVVLYTQNLWWIGDSASPSPERLGFSCKLGWREFSHSFQVPFAGHNTLSGDMMSQIVNHIPEKFALSGF